MSKIGGVTGALRSTARTEPSAPKDRERSAAGIGVGFAEPNVRAKREPTAGRQGPTAENVHRTCRRALVACRWRSA